MYTSGSSGAPKGVVTTHRDVVDLVSDRCWQQSGPQRVLLHAPYAFDASTYELWVPLLSGGQVVIAPPHELDAARLRSLIASHELTHVHVTAGLCRVLAEAEPACFAGVREVLTGGDVVRGGGTAGARGMPGGPGPASVRADGDHAVRAPSTQRTSPGRVPPVLPIGPPADNTRVYVLRYLAAPGAGGGGGELYVAGRAWRGGTSAGRG